MSNTNPIRPTDDAARTLAISLLGAARFGALAVIDAQSRAPMATRVAVSTTNAGAPLLLISDLSQHTSALKQTPICSLLVGEPGPKGDPLTHPRLTLQCRAEFTRHGQAQHPDLRKTYLKTHPKSKLYIDFADFSFVILNIETGFLNGGFGKAFHLTKSDFTAKTHL